MKIRLMGTREQNSQFISLLRSLPELIIISESKPYPNRGSDIQERVYLEIQQDTIYTSADVINNFNINSKTNLRAMQSLEDIAKTIFVGYPTTDNNNYKGEN